MQEKTKERKESKKKMRSTPHLGRRNCMSIVQVCSLPRALHADLEYIFFFEKESFISDFHW